MKNPMTSCGAALALLASLAAACGGEGTNSTGSGGGTSSSSSSSSSSSASSSSSSGSTYPAGCGEASDSVPPWNLVLNEETEETMTTPLLLPGVLPVAPDGSTVILSDASGGSLPIYPKLTKINGAGEPVWTKLDVSSAPLVVLSAPALDPQDCSILVAGSVRQGINEVFGQSASCSTANCPFVARLDGGGSVVWVKVFDFGGGGWVLPWIGGLAADGRIALVGSFEDTIDLGNGPLQAPPTPGSGVFVALLSTSGESLWSRHFALENTGAPGVGAAVSPAGDVAVTTRGNGAVDFGEGFIPMPGAPQLPSLVLAAYDSTGARRYGKMLGFDAGAPDSFSLAYDSAGNLIVAGGALGAMDFGGGPVADPTEWVTAAASFDATGQHLWSAAVGAEPFVQTALAVDAADHVWIGAGSGELLELDAAGALVAMHPLDGSGSRYVWGIGFAPAGKPMIAGWFDGSVDLGFGPIFASSMRDTFIAALE